MMHRVPLTLALLAAILAQASGGEVDPAAPSAAIAADAELLCGFGDRSPGSVGADKAAEWLVARLTELTPEVAVQLTPIIVPVDKGSNLVIGDLTVPLTPHLPNGMGMPGARQPIDSRLVFVGDGSLTDLEGKDLTGAIAVIDGVSGRNWTNCARLGASAVIFRQPALIDQLALAGQYFTASIEFPRFVADLPSELDGRTARLTSTVLPETVMARTVVARIRGTANVISAKDGRRETVVLSSGYESGGLLRGCDPGATRAWNAALLLDLARRYASAPLRRDLLVVFHGARAEMFRGLRQLCASHGDIRRLRDIEDQRVAGSAWRWNELRSKERLHSLIQELEVSRDQTQVLDDVFRAFLDRCAVGAPPATPEPELASLIASTANRCAAVARTGDDELATSQGEKRPWIRGVQVLGLAFIGLAGWFAYRRHRRSPLTLKNRLGLVGAGLVILIWSLASTGGSRQEPGAFDHATLRELAWRFLADQAGRHADELRPRAQEARMRLRDLDPEDGEFLRLQEACTSDEAEMKVWRNIQQKLGRKALDPLEAGRVPILIRELVEAGDGVGLTPMRRHAQVIADQLQGYRSSSDLWQRFGDARLVHLIDFDLTDGNQWFSIFLGDPYNRWGKNLRMFRDEFERLATKAIAADPLVHYASYPWEVSDPKSDLIPTDHLNAANKVNDFVNTISIGTINDRRNKLGTPQDTFATFQADDFLQQVHGLPGLLRSYLDTSRVGREHVLGADYNVARSSPQVTIEAPSEGSLTGRAGMPFPCVLIQPTTHGAHMRAGSDGVDIDRIYYRYFGDIKHIETFWGDAFGQVRVPWLPATHSRYSGRGNRVLIGYCAYDATGRITQVPAATGSRTTKLKKNKPYWTLDQGAVGDVLLLAFPAVHGALFDIFDPRILSTLTTIKVCNAYRNSPPNYAFVEHDDGAIGYFTPRLPTSPLRILASEGQIGNRFVLLGEPVDKRDVPVGDHLDQYDHFRGFPPVGFACASTRLAQAEDMWQLNEIRFRQLRGSGINPESLLGLHSRAEHLLQRALDEYAAGRLERAETAALSSWAFSERVYQPLKGTANDVIYGLVIMLLFSIPFAVILERLFIAGNTIFKKVGAFIAFFAVTFLFFYWLHPAFDLANNPIIIFLSFVIISTSALVMSILINRFEHEMELIRMAGLGLHKVDVSRLGTLLATLTLGVSNMRRRPLRTFLTAITVVLMTFILLTFSSFNSAAGFRVTNINHRPAYDGIFLAMPGWMSIRHQTYDHLRSSLADSYDFFPNYWIDHTDTRERFYFDTPRGPILVEGMMSLEFDDPAGIERALHQPGRETPGFNGEEDWIFLPPRLISQAGIKPGDSIMVFGYRLRVGTIDAEVLEGLTHINGEALTPLQKMNLTPEESDQLQKLGQNIASGEEVTINISFDHLPANAVAVLHNRYLRRMGGGLRSVAMVPRDDQVSPRATAEELASRIGIHFVYAENGEVQDIVGIDRFAVTGLLDVLIPLLLGGLIIFSTMLNSVAERNQEIFIYASLGLAPIHIGVLFLVEASIYAVIGGMGGYMLAQVISDGLGFLSRCGLVAQPDMNFSSMTAVLTILLVMATVLISAIYPALVASRAAMPGGGNNFVIPEPTGDRLEIPFPFTVAARDVIGLLAYLRHYIHGHTEASVGCFTSAEAEMHTLNQSYAVTARIWLAPFDLGISQRFRMDARVTDVKAIYAVHISLQLLSGQRSAWRAVLGPFLQELRQQFLVWRTLDDTTRDRYQALGGDPEAQRRVDARQREIDALRQRQDEEEKARKERLKDELRARTGDQEALARLTAAAKPPASSCRQDPEAGDRP